MTLEKESWYWGKFDKAEANKALEKCIDGTFLVRESSTPPDCAIHVVYKGMVRLLKVLVVNGRAGFTEDCLKFNNVLSLVDHFTRNSLANQNKNINVMLTTPLPKPVLRELFDKTIEGDMWPIYIDSYVSSENLTTQYNECNRKIASAEKDCQKTSYQATAQHEVIQIWREQLEIKSMSLTHFSAQYKDMIERNFATQSQRLVDAECKLDEISGSITDIQRSLRDLVLQRKELETLIHTEYRKLDWYERLLKIEMFDQETVKKCMEPFTQNLGSKLLLIEGVKEMWFAGRMNRDMAEQALQGKSSGTYLVRCNDKDQFVLSVVNRRDTRHILILEERGKFGLKLPTRYDSVPNLINSFKVQSLGTQDSNFHTRLEIPIFDS